LANGKNDDSVVQSSGNVFADLGLRAADEKQTRVRLAVAINQIIQARHRSQIAAARLDFWIGELSFRGILRGTPDAFSECA
jgi:hypothetical protein